MEVFEGKSVCGGIAIGTIRVWGKRRPLPERREVVDTEAEVQRLFYAKEAAGTQLEELYQKTKDAMGESAAAIFHAHKMLLEDPEYFYDAVETVRSGHVNAEYAILLTAQHISRMFERIDNADTRARIVDVQDISRRLVAVLGGGESAPNPPAEPVIVAAEDLTPSETVQIENDKVLSFVTVRGSLNSHTAILARTMAIPALVGTPLPLDESVDGKTGIVDGTTGKLYVDPDAETLHKMRKKQAAEAEKKALLQKLRGKETVTTDGRKVMLYANIGAPGDLAAVLQNDAEGIGLFRSEFLYLERETYPTEEEQFRIYRQVAETMEGKPVIIRTLDLGADKQCGYLKLEPEENPAMGCRAIRLCLLRPDVFKTQLRALLRAGVFGNISMMYPMIISVKEVRQIKEIVAEAAAELTKQGIAFRLPKQGIMIETPAAALISGELAKEVDFFSIGTNDLTQYTLAIDRQNTGLDIFYDAHHPAVLRMIAMVVENAHRAGIPAGICGELGADLSLTREFLDMGVDELSVSPGNILSVREKIREI